MKWRILSRLSLSQRLSMVFTALLLACCGASLWLQMRANVQHEQEVTQRLSLGLAAHIADNSALMASGGLNNAAVKDLFDKLMAVNPSVEVYLLSMDGDILAQAAPDTQMFCSQLVALTYQRAGLLSTEHVPNWYSPNSFSAGYHALHLLQGASLDPEVPIDVDGH